MQRRPWGEIVFVSVALGLSVGYWVLLRVAGEEPFGIGRGVWGALRAYGPAVAAVIAALWSSGTAGVREVGARLAKWRVPGRLLLAALLVPLAANLIGAFAAYFLTGADLTLGEIRPGRFVLLFFVLAIVDGPLGEEIGWRGYLLPALLRKVRPLAASAIVGVVWFVWHLPLYAADGRSFSGEFLPMYFAFTMAYSVIMTWLFLRSHESALLAVFVHTATNYFTVFKMTLFPQLRATTVDERVYVAIAVLLAIAAAVSMQWPRSKGNVDCGQR